MLKWIKADVGKGVEIDYHNHNLFDFFWANPKQWWIGLRLGEKFTLFYLHVEDALPYFLVILNLLVKDPNGWKIYTPKSYRDLKMGVSE